MVDIDGEPLLVGDDIYAATYQGRLGAISRGTGRNLWSQDTSSHHAPAHRAGKIYVTNLNKLIETFLSFFDFLKLFFIDSSKNKKQNEHIMLHKEINLDEKI